MKLQFIVSAALALFSTVPGAVVSASAPLESVDFDSADLAEFNNAADEPFNNNVFVAVANDACYNNNGRRLGCDVGYNSCTNVQRQDCCRWVGSRSNGRCEYRNGGGSGGGNRRCDSNFANRSRNNCVNRTSGSSCKWVQQGTRSSDSFCTFSSAGSSGGGNRRCDSAFAMQSRNNCVNRTSGNSCQWVTKGNGRSFCQFRNYYDASADFEYDFNESANSSSEDEYDFEESADSSSEDELSDME